MRVACGNAGGVLEDEKGFLQNHFSSSNSSCFKYKSLEQV
jgi:hypothetical protein